MPTSLDRTFPGRGGGGKFASEILDANSGVGPRVRRRLRSISVRHRPGWMRMPEEYVPLARVRVKGASLRGRTAGKLTEVALVGLQPRRTTVQTGGTLLSTDAFRSAAPQLENNSSSFRGGAVRIRELFGMTDLVCISSRNTGDRGRVVFDVVHGGQTTSCDISHGALEKLGGTRIVRNGEALEIFVAFRDPDRVDRPRGNFRPPARRRAPPSLEPPVPGRSRFRLLGPVADGPRPLSARRMKVSSDPDAQPTS